MPDEAMFSPEEVREDYNRAVRDARGEYVAHRWFQSAPQRRHYHQTRVSLTWAAGSLAPGALLEVGCGPAVWTPIFLPAATSVTLLDISDEMLHGARRALADRPQVRFVRADFAEADLPPGSFDTLVSVRAFEYMPDKSAVMQRFSQVLAPGGRLVLVTKNAGWRDHARAQAAVQHTSTAGVPRHIRLQAGVAGWRDLAGMASAAGFVDVSVHPVVVGSYEAPWTTWPALVACDLVQRAKFRGPMTDRLSPWVESVQLMGRKPG